MAYPVCRLRSGVRRHVAWLADAAIDVAAEYGIRAAYSDEKPGVWVDGTHKLAAIGVHVERHVAIHGLSINVLPAATAMFRRGWFAACGETDGLVTSLAEAGARPDGAPPSVEAVATRLAAALLRRAGAHLPGEGEGDGDGDGDGDGETAPPSVVRTTAPLLLQSLERPSLAQP